MAKKDKPWKVYIIQTETGRLYTGITTDIIRRFAEHTDTFNKKSSKGARFFRSNRPLKIVFQEKHPNRSSACRREAEIKGMSRALKLQLISPLGKNQA